MKEDTPVYTAYEDFEAHDTAESEKNLMLAILKNAMGDIDKNGKLQNEAKEYFLNADEQYLYSFASICTHLDLCEKTIKSLVGLYPKNPKKK